jgi:hypothetical protein
MIKCPNCSKLCQYVIAAITETEHSSMKDDKLIGDGMFKERDYDKEYLH